jgi:2-amino-4-hydroxy-6-hydroxymethyldihydropteridine diphosphokinase
VGAATDAYLGLGSNVGDRLENLRAAVRLLDATAGIDVLKRSSVYETEPVGRLLDQRDFYNAALLIETTLDPRELLEACKAVERELGREPGGVRHGPRPIDVDLLLIGDVQMEKDGLVLPHPEATSRRFVLQPLLELDPGLASPGGAPLAEALAALGPGQSVERVAEL